MLVVWHKEVVALYVDVYSQSFKGVGYQSEVLYGYVLNANALSNHGCHADKRPHFNHVG